LCKNKATKSDLTDDFLEYCKLRDSSEKAYHFYRNCKRKYLNQGDDGCGPSGINFKWPDIDNKDYQDALQAAKEGKSPNNISPIIQYSLNDGVTAMWMGDLESDFMEKLRIILI